MSTELTGAPAQSYAPAPEVIQETVKPSVEVTTKDSAENAPVVAYEPEYRLLKGLATVVTAQLNALPGKPQVIQADFAGGNDLTILVFA